MAIHLAIPSFQRPQTLLKKTAHYLDGTGFHPASKTVFVANKDEYDRYRPLLGQEWQVKVGGPTLKDQRAAIDREYPVGTQLLCLDDDLDRLVIRLTTKKLEPLLNLTAVAQQGFALAEGGLWGVYPVANALFMQPRVTQGLAYVVGCCYGYTVSHDPGLQTTLEDKEDFERTLLYYRRFGKVTRLEWVAPVTNYYTEPGGMQVTRTRGRVLKASEDLVRRFPRWCKLSEHEKSGWLEVKLKA